MEHDQSTLNSSSTRNSGLESCMDVTVYQAENLPTLERSFSKERKFYITVTDGAIVKKTAAIRSATQAVQWNETLGAFDYNPSSHIIVSLYAKKTIGRDVLVGKKEIPCHPQSYAESITTLYCTATLSLESGEGCGGITTQPVKVRLKITTHPNPGPSPAVAASASNSEIHQPETFSVAAASIPLSTKNLVGTAQPTIPQPPPSQTEEQSPPLPPKTDDVQMSAKHTLDKAYEAMESIPVLDPWKNTFQNIELAMEKLGSLTELHPFAKMAWGILKIIPDAYLQQVQHDENVRHLLEAIDHGFDFVKEAGALKNIIPESRQVEILKLMLRHVCNCGDFILTYARDTKFRKRFVTNISGRVDDKINEYSTTLDQLRREFFSLAAVTTEITTFQILDDMGTISVNVENISTQLNHLSTKVSESDFESKMRELPYKPALRSGVERDFLAGTRTAFLDHIINWVNDPDADRGLILFGQAGTGKSSIAHEVTRRLREMNRLSSYFIFLRKEQSRSEDYFLFTSLVHDLSDRYPSFKFALGKAFENKFYRAAQDYDTLFEHLLLQPLRGLHIVGPIVVVIDALDESGNASEARGLHTFLAHSISKLPPQFRVLITSRPEKPIIRAFAKAISVRIVEITDPKFSAATNEDIGFYLRERLPRHVFERHGEKLAAKAGGFFQWAAVACKYISSPPAGFTEERCIKRLFDSSSKVKGLELLDRLYQDILEGYFEPDVRPLFQSIMGQLLATFEPLSIISLTSLRQCASHGERDEEGSVFAIVSHLGSLLSNVTSPESLLPILPLHTSFRDFLTDAKKSGDFYVDLKRAHHDLADCCLGLMRDELKFNICKLESSYLANKDVPKIAERISQYIPRALSYSSRFWANHLERLVFHPDLFVGIQKILNDKFLYWLEVLSLTGNVSLAPPALSVLKTWLISDKDSYSDTLTDFHALLNDAWTFVRYFGMPISKSAPHIYISCLPFAPTSSHIFRRYYTRFPHTLSLGCGRLSRWPALEMVIPTRSGVLSVSFSPDGRYIVSGLQDHTIRVWNAGTGEMVRSPFTGHSGSVNSVAFSPDGQLIVSGSGDGTVYVWDAGTGEVVGNPFTGHTGVTFSPDGQYITSGSHDGTVRLWHVRTGEIVGNPYTGHTDSVNSVAYSPNGEYIVSGSDDCTVRVWNAKTGETVGDPFTVKNASINSVAFSPDGQSIVSGSSDGTIRVWDAEAGEMVGNPLTGHSGFVNSVAYSPDGQFIVSGSSVRTIRVWNTGTGKMVGNPYTGHGYWVRSVEFSPDGQFIVSGSPDGTIRVWNVGTGEKAGHPSTGYPDFVNSLANSLDEQFTGSGSGDAGMSATIGKPFTGHSGSVNCVAFSPDGLYIVSGSHDGTIRVWNATMGEMVGNAFIGHDDWVKSVAFSPDGQFIVSGSDDHTIRVWNARTGESVGYSFTKHAHWVNSVAYSPDGQFIVSGSSDRTIRVWNAGTGEIVGTPFTGHAGSVNSVAFSPDGQLIVSGSYDCTIRVWNAMIGEMATHPFTGHTDSVNSVVYSPNGEYIVSGSFDRTICVWNAGTGEMVRNFTGHGDWVKSVAWSPDGNYIVSGSHDHTICVRNARTGEIAGKPLHIRFANSVAFSPDGQFIISGSGDHTVRMFHNPAVALSLDTTHAHFSDDSVINYDGWIYGQDGELVLWIPQLHRSGLHRPSSVWFVEQHETRMDLSHSMHGSDWAKCIAHGSKL